MGRTRRWLRNTGIALLAATGLAANTWSTPPEDSIRSQVKQVTLAPVHKYAVNKLEQDWTERLQVTKDTAAARAVLEGQVQPLRERAPRRISLNTYRQEVQEVINTTQENTDWNYLARRFSLDNERAEVAREIASSVTANNIITIGLAETTPRVPQTVYQRIAGTRAQRVIGPLLLEARLRLLGQEIVNLQPSRHDTEVSYGLWQKTNPAVNSHPDSLGGASIASLALPDSLRLVNKIEYLQGIEHPKAAVLMHNYNVFRAVRNTPEEVFSTLADNTSDPEVVRSFMLMHHAPRRGEKALYGLLTQPETGLRAHADTTLHNYIDRLELYTNTDKAPGIRFAR